MNEEHIELDKAQQDQTKLIEELKQIQQEKEEIQKKDKELKESVKEKVQKNFAKVLLIK